MNAQSGKDIISKNGFQAEVKPMLSTHWSQNGGENSLLPFVSDGVHAKTGCGATALAQVMCYWKHPKKGSGSNYYYWESVKGREQMLYADFENTSYDWDNMIALYKNNPNATKKQIEAVSTLMAHIGIALEMKYMVDSTATNIEYIHTALNKFFRYNTKSKLVRYINGAYSMEEWLTLIYKELHEGRPVLMGGTRNGINRIFVADGYDKEGLVHLNLGHANEKEDIYYDLSQQGQTYTENMRMIIGICPNTMDIEEELTTVRVTTPGTLKEKLGGDPKSRRICRLKVIGAINEDDIQWLNELSISTKGQLSYLDLSDCSIQGNKLPSSAFDSCMTLQEIILPNSLTSIGTKAFRECTGLRMVHIPERLTRIESYAFSNCRYLGDLHLPATLTTIGNNPFRYDKLEIFDIDNNNNNFKIVNHALLSIDGKKLISMPFKYIGKYYVPNGVETIAIQSFFKACMISALVLPSSLKQIQSNAIFQCYNLSDVYSHATSAPSLTDSSFDASVKFCTLHVPAGRISEYEQKGWSMFANIVDDLSPVKDVNGDGSIDITDVVCLVNRILGSSGDESYYYDINNDGTVDISDVVNLVNIILAQLHRNELMFAIPKSRLEEMAEYIHDTCLFNGMAWQKMKDRINE